MDRINIILILLGVNIILLISYINNNPIIFIKEQIKNLCFNCIDNGNL